MLVANCSTPERSSRPLEAASHAAWISTIARLNASTGALETHGTRRLHGDEAGRGELEDGARHFELELPDATADLGDAAPPVALGEHASSSAGGFLAPAWASGAGTQASLGIFSRKKSQLVGTPRRLHEERTRAEVVPAHELGIVEPLEEEERRPPDVHGRVEHLFDLARHHAKELVRADELELDGGLADAPPALIRRAHDLLELVPGDDPEAPQNLAEPLARRVRRGADDMAALEEDGPHEGLRAALRGVFFLEDDELSAPPALRDRGDHVAEGTGRAHLAGQPESARPLPARSASTTSVGDGTRRHSPARARSCCPAARPTGCTVPVPSIREILGWGHHSTGYQACPAQRRLETRAPRICAAAPDALPLNQASSRISQFVDHAEHARRAMKTAATPTQHHAALARALAEVGYLSDDRLALAAWLALALERPLLVEGPAGVGKTDLARALAEALARELVRLQCYEGLDEAKALYEWDYAKQMLYTQLLRDAVSRADGGRRLARRSRRPRRRRRRRVLQPAVPRRAAAPSGADERGARRDARRRGRPSRSRVRGLPARDSGRTGR